MAADERDDGDDETALDEPEGDGQAAGKGADGKRHTLFEVRVFCVGTEPLLMNRFPPERLVQTFYTKDADPKSPDTPLEDLAAPSLFRDERDNLAISLNQVRASMCVAGAKVGLKGRVNLSKAGGKESLVPQFIRWLDGEYTPLLTPDGAQAEKWKVDLKRGQLPTGGPCPVLRGRIDDWAFLLRLLADLSKVPGVTLAHVRKLIDQAGLTGIGGFRNYYGKFVVAEGGWLVTKVDPSTIVRPKAPAHLMAPPPGAIVHETA